MMIVYHRIIAAISYGELPTNAHWWLGPRMNMALAASIDDASAISNDGPNDILWRLASPSVPCMGEIFAPQFLLNIGNRKDHLKYFGTI